MTVKITEVADVITLLPENIANQIAAGEVIQRPASAVKELLENAVDAGATEIQLIVNDAGKTLVQVIDNGCGMSETDARMCFERHATSKIKTIEDLFHIRTMGFRGEALASIAAVSQVELKTKRKEDAAGTYIEIENSVVLRQEPVAVPDGTSIAMKNLFFNIPARRNFLKSDAVEMRHIVEEFTRVGLAFPAIRFSLTANHQPLYLLEPGSLKQRMLQLWGNSYQNKLITIKEETDYLNIYGFAGKPETAKRTRGDQYFFVNRRYIKSPYLHHAILSAYQDLIPADSHPLYVLFLEIDPSQIDVNVHPAKQEIKFEDEKIIYAFVQAAVRHALAQFSITPSLDFDLDPAIQQLPAIQQPFTDDKRKEAEAGAIFRTFTQKHQAHFIEKHKMDPSVWKNFYEKPAPAPESASSPSERLEFPSPEIFSVFPLHNTYLIAQTANSFFLIHQQAAHERILYEKMKQAGKQNPIPSQRTLFPATLELSPADAAVMEEIIPELQWLGFLIEPFGNNTYIIQGVPGDITPNPDNSVIEILLEQYKHFNPDIKVSVKEKLIRSLARQHAVKGGTKLSENEMYKLVQDLFRCETPAFAPDGKPAYIEFSKDQLEAMFGR
ncbi:MAG: DNA mismatch repair endonuclease MutL [Chitinophagaceae bacterium]|nr:DNA mismatch repair endonuclease MutL [Chitinophagaceae bacterium]